jgi:hypothetical protein
MEVAKFQLLVFLDYFICSFQLIEEEKQGKSIELLESSSEDDEKDARSAEEEDCEHAATTAVAVATMRRALSMKKVL